MPSETIQSNASLGSSRSPSATGLIIRQWEPANLEFPFASLDAFITPTEQFYVRSHFPTPSIDAKAWRLKVEGLVQKPAILSLAQLMRMPAHSQLATLECAGNGRIFLHPKVNGAQWELGAVSNALWTGVRLADVLREAGVSPTAVDVILEGADTGQPDEKPKPPGDIHYARAIPFTKADDVLLAYQMNGEPLPLSHGAPLRAIVPGWYGMASVKWLRRIIVTDQPFQGYFQTVDYAYWADHAGIPTRVPISRMRVKSQIARPGWHEIVPAGRPYRIAGAAWTGDSDVTRVEVSTDAGMTFANATLLGDAIRHAWRLWEYNWQAPSHPGQVILTSRATDAHGDVQPARHNPNFVNYIIDHTLPVEVIVR